MKWNLKSKNRMKFEKKNINLTNRKSVQFRTNSKFAFSIRQKNVTKTFDIFLTPLIILMQLVLACRFDKYLDTCQRSCYQLWFLSSQKNFGTLNYPKEFSEFSEKHASNCLDFQNLQPFLQPEFFLGIFWPAKRNTSTVPGALTLH